MTAAAVGSELTVVNVIGTMTVRAVLAQARLRGKRLPVTALARDVCVCTVKRETRLLVVVEQPLLPVDRVVAQPAILAEATVVRVVFAVATEAVFRCVAKYVRLVALAAVGFRVFTKQRKPGEVVVEKDIVLPRRFTVAVEALRALCALVGVIVLVTRETVAFQLHFVNRLDVAGSTLGFPVRTDQCVAGVFLMIEMHIGPAAAGVTGLAALSEMTLVIVVFPVAGDARHVEFVGERVVAVAAIAILLRMLAIQWEIRIAIVIEARIVPAPRVVAVAALVAAAAIVRIVFRMAVVAFSRRILKRIVGMAVQALGLLVLADQRIIGGVVIELDIVPFHRGVAVAAGRPQRLAVRVMFFVAGIAVAGRIAMFLVLRVARGTLALGMLAE